MEKLKTTFLMYIIPLYFGLLSLNGEAQYTKLMDFDSVASGLYPNTNFIYDGTFLYGTMKMGGVNGAGTIFKIKQDGTGYLKLLDFNYGTNGYRPVGSLISDGTFFYGTTYLGGANNLGVVYKIKADGTGYTKLIDFGGAIDGSNPSGSLFCDGTFLYGMTGYGGINNGGTIYKIKPNGTGYSKIFDFGPNATGAGPLGALILEGDYLYGGTYYGGTNNRGVIFQIKPDGTGYSKLLDFNYTNGSYPTNALVSDGIFLYGMTYLGGANIDGLIYKIKLDGTGYMELFDFAGASNGSSPNGSLIFDGTFLYGVTSSGGANSYGVIFKIKTDGTGYQNMYDFDWTNGGQPNGTLFSDGIFLYGTTSNGGANHFGTIFKYHPLGMGVSEDNNQQSTISLYPNPFTSQTTITFSEVQKNTTIKIMDILGNEIKEIKFTGTDFIIEKGEMKKGIYFVQTTDEKKHICKRKIIMQ